MSPVSPISPVGPVGPVSVDASPVGPVSPVSPVMPSGPVTPVSPVTPVAPPTGPVGPVGPVPSGPVSPDTPVSPVGPVGPVGPIGKTFVVDPSSSLRHHLPSLSRMMSDPVGQSVGVTVGSWLTVTASSPSPRSVVPVIAILYPHQPVADFPFHGMSRVSANLNQDVVSTRNDINVVRSLSLAREWRADRSVDLRASAVSICRRPPDVAAHVDRIRSPR